MSGNASHEDVILSFPQCRPRNDHICYQIHKRQRQQRSHLTYQTSPYSIGYSNDQISQMGLYVPAGRIIHEGCVNAVTFSTDGRFLYTGSDDRLIKIWNSEKDFALEKELPTGHRHNIFAVSPVPGSQGRLVASCSGDGTIRVTDIEYERESILGVSNSIMHGFAFGGGMGYEGTVVYTAQQDGFICRYDIREARSVHFSPNGVIVLPPRMGARSIGAFVPVKALMIPNPNNQCKGLSPNMLFVGGESPVLEVFDVRKMASMSIEAGYSSEELPTSDHGVVPLFRICPTGLDPNAGNVSVSGLVCSNTRSEVLVSYQGDQIYGFSMVGAGTYGPNGDYLPHAYSLGGHINHDTFLKNVSYFGPEDEYVSTGSDSGHTWVFDRRTRRVVSLLKSDDSYSNGSVPHPALPMLATYGIESSVRIWQVGGEEEERGGLKKRVMKHLPEVLEQNLQQIRRKEDPNTYVANVELFEEHVRHMRCSKAAQAYGIPDYPSDISGNLPPIPVLLLLLNRTKDRGNSRFKIGDIDTSISCYQKVLRYVNRLLKGAAKGGGRRISGRVRARGFEESLEDVITSFDKFEAYEPQPASVGGEEEEIAEEEKASLLELQMSCYLNLSACRLSKKEYRDAIRMANQVLAKNPQHSKALFRRGCAALESGDAETAVKDLSLAHKLQSEDKVVLRKLRDAKKALEKEKSKERKAFQAIFSSPAGEV